jgi:iron(III) transport system ATP-binding protein
MSLSARNIRHSFGGGVAAVDDASIDAAPGEIVCLFGPSGCGKTTLLRIIAGLEPLQEGMVSIDGQVLDAPPERRPIGFVFQDLVLFPHMTAAENVAFGISHLPKDERVNRVGEELARAGLQELGARYPHQLSGGQQQRVALARAFARRPRAMLLDEPFASIDVALRRRLRAEMRAILKSYSTPAILVTHDPDEAIELGDRIAIMDSGRIIETATPEDLFRMPTTAAGAAIFPGSQSFPCSPVDGGVEAEFGRVAPLARPADAGVVVVREGGFAAVEDGDGAFLVADCRFAGPAWCVDLSYGAGKSLKSASGAPIAVGKRARLIVDPAAARAVSGARRK